MHEEQMTRRLERAIRVASDAWDRAHEGLPGTVMTRSAAIPATGILAATLLAQLDDHDDATLTARVEKAIRVARRAWERTHGDPPGNPIAMTATRSVVGILAAGILDLASRRHGAREPRPADPAGDLRDR